MKRILHRLARWLARKTAPAFLAPSSGPWPIDAYRRLRAPSGAELLAELKSTAWACASINAAVCAASPPRLYVHTGPGEPQPRCLTRSLEPNVLQRLRTPHPQPLSPKGRGESMIEEVVDHPLLTLLQQVNPVHNQFDLWEL